MRSSKKAAWKGDKALKIPNELKQHELGAIYLDRMKETLMSVGWLESAIEKSALDEHGKPSPWYTYAALHFVRDRVKPDWRVFEYGSGQSTGWWAQRTRQVIAVEHQAGWARKVAGFQFPNTTVVFRELTEDGDYAREILQHEGLFDLVVIDGRDRVNCAKYALDKLSAKGVILWDNSDRERYQPGFDMLLSRGFRKLDFWGFGPVVTGVWMTSVFYRDGNCMGI